MQGSGVVVGIDGSPGSVGALRWGHSAAARLGVPVIAVMAWEYPVRYALPGSGTPDLPPEGMDERVTAEVARIVGEAGLAEVDSRAARGPAAHALREEAARLDARMLVVGTRGLGAVPGLLLGSVSRRLLFASPCPVVLVPGTAEAVHASLDRVLVGIDGSPASHATGRWAARLCRDLAASALVVQCVSVGSERPSGFVEETVARIRSTLDADGCARFRELGVDHEAVALDQDPRSGLIDHGRQHDAGLIVVGARGTGKFQGLGGTASYLARHSHLPLAVVTDGGHLGEGV